MTKSLFVPQITLEEALKIVTFEQDADGTWYVTRVQGDCATVEGRCETVKGNCGTVEGDCYLVKGDCDFVEGEVLDTINGRKWAYVETPREKLQRLIEKTDNQELIDAFNQLENN